MFRLFSTLLCILFSVLLCSSSAYVQNFSSFNNVVKTVSQKSTIKEPIKKQIKKVNTTIDTSNLNSKEYEWYSMPGKDGSPPTMPPEIKYQLSTYNTCFLGDTTQKEIYLTFDEGYENGYTSKILDILKANNVKAAFFVTTPYILANKDIIKRMTAEGHLVCNHTWRHRSMASLASDKSTFKKEFTSVEDAYKSVTGLDMVKIFRPPMGKYSELSLKETAELGYKTVFWSFAYEDWIPTKQPSPAASKEKILSKTTDGSIVLLHAVSKTNTEILDSVLKGWKSMGYEVKSIDKLPKT
jgi:peptidoglycan-N-acetylmuramic acid deacetylase